MRKIIAVVWFCLFSVSALAQSVGGGVNNPPAPGQLLGTTTNNNATAGNVGEYIVSNCQGSTLTATVTITIATPGVVTWTAHGFINSAVEKDACPVVFTTSGALPTGIISGTTYYVVPSSITTNTFQVATTVANAIAGTSINTTGTQSGTQTGTAGTSLANNTAADTTGIPLTAGDWTICGLMIQTSSGGTSVTLVEGQINTTSATRATAPNNGAYFIDQSTHTAGAGVTATVGCMRQSVSATTNLFLVAFSQFTTTTNVANGTLWARRAR